SGGLNLYQASPAPGVYSGGYLMPHREDDPFISGHDLTWYKANRPDWIHFQNDRVTPYALFTGTFFTGLDFMNPEVRRYKLDWALRQRVLDQGFACISWDNCVTENGGVGGAYRAGHYQDAVFDAGGNLVSGTWVQQYTGIGDPQFTADFIDFLGWMKARL